MEGVLSSAAGISLVSWSKGPGFFGQVDSALDSNPGPGFFCWWVEPLDGVGKLVSRGRGSCSLSSTTSSSRRQCDGGGRSGLFSNCDSFYQLCQLSALPASILGLSEQTKTGATRGRGRQSQGPCSYYWRRRIQYTSRLVFAFFDSIIGGVFLSI